MARWLRRLLFGSSIALALFTTTGFFILPPLLRHLAESQLSERLGRKVKIERVRVNPFAFSLAIEGFQVLEADGKTPFVTFGRFYVNAEAASIYRRAPVLREVRLESPRIRVVRLTATAGAWADPAAYNFSDIVARFVAASKAAEQPLVGERAPPRFSVNNIQILDGELMFEDRPLQVRHEVTGLRLGIPFVSTLPVDVDTFVEPRLNLRVDGTSFGLKGRTKPFEDSLQTIVELRFNDLDLTRYVPYVPVPLGFDVTSARLTLALDVSFARPRTGAPLLSVTGQVALRDVALHEASPSGRPLVGLDELAVTIGAADLPARRLVLDKVLISGLDVHARRLADGSLDLERLIAGPPAARKGSDAGRRAVTPPGGRQSAREQRERFSVGEIRIQKTVLHLRDESVRPPFEEVLNDVTASVKRLSNTPGAVAKLEASVHGGSGWTLKQEGHLTIDPFTTNGTISLDGIEPGRFAAYYRDAVAFDVAKGRLRVATGYWVRENGDHLLAKLDGAFVEATDLALRWRGRKGEKAEIARIPQLAARGGAVDFATHTVSVAEVISRDGRLQVARAENGIIDLTTLAGSTASTTREPAGPGWAFALARLDMQGWGVRFEDRAVEPHAVLGAQSLSLLATDVSTTRGSRGKVDLRLGLKNKGRLAVAGSVSLLPVAVDLRVDLRACDVVPLQPYLKDQVNLTVTRGMVSAKVQARFELPEQPGRSPADPRLSLAGDIDVADFSSVDTAKKEDLLRWRSFHVGGLKLSTGPLVVGIREAVLSDFDARMIMFPDGHFNLTDALAGPTPPRPSAPVLKASPARKPSPQDSPRPKITIGAVTFERGQVAFTDRTIQPRYTTALTELGGRLTGLSSDAGTQADVEIKGAIDHTGPIAISGRINPLAKNLFVDMKVSAKDLDLPPASPYSGKYLGYAIRKGKLSLALDYHIARRQLDAKNRVILDQLTFGEKVHSPDAVNLPVKLAVAILKDRHGVIDIDLPVSGSLDDPHFRVGRIILKTLGNLVVRAVTAPFSLIAKAFGGGDEMSVVEFPLGLSTLDSRGRQKVQGLARALQERDELSFEIQGGADPARDREALRRTLYERKLKAQRMTELVRGGGSVGSADELRLDAADVPRLVGEVYKTETFAKPRNFLGMVKSLPVGEMEKLIQSNIRLDDEDLRALALRRAGAVKDTLAKLTPGAVPRLFLVSPRVANGGNRVEFKLKAH